MANTPTDPLSDAQVAKLVQFDEALRQGKEPSTDPDIEPAQEFLRRLQTVWKRGVRRIGPYLLIRNLGQGSLGPSYLAENSATHEQFILKTLWPDLHADESARQRLLNEVQRHVQQGSIKEVSIVGQVLYFISEFHPGPSLGQWRERHPQPLPWPGAALLIAHLADQLEDAHRAGFVHGNVKPSNLFLPHENISPRDLHETPLRIAEAGLAKAILPMRSLPWPMPHYLAPEQLSHRHCRTEPASDIYALGVLLYELLTSRAPVQGLTREEVHRTQRETKPPAPSRHCRDLPPILDALVLKCLERKPANRPTSAQHLAASLRTLAKPQSAWWKRWLAGPG